MNICKKLQIRQSRYCFSFQTLEAILVCLFPHVQQFKTTKKKKKVENSCKRPLFIYGGTSQGVKTRAFQVNVVLKQHNSNTANFEMGFPKKIQIGAHQNLHAWINSVSTMVAKIIKYESYGESNHLLSVKNAKKEK